MRKPLGAPLAAASGSSRFFQLSVMPTYLMFSTFWKTVDAEFITQAILMFIIARGKGIAQKDYFYEAFTHVRCRIRLFTFLES